MTIRTTGAEWKRFYADETVWLPGYCHEDETVEVNGLESGDLDLSTVADDDELSIVCGCVYDGDGEYLTSLEKMFRKWCKAQTMTTFLVECRKEDAERVLAAVKAAGGKVR